MLEDSRRSGIFEVTQVTPQFFVTVRFSVNSLTRLIRAYRDVKIASLEESGSTVTHENVPVSSNRNYERRSSKLEDETAKCPSCI